MLGTILAKFASLLFIILGSTALRLLGFRQKGEGRYGNGRVRALFKETESNGRVLRETLLFCAWKPTDTEGDFKVDWHTLNLETREISPALITMPPEVGDGFSAVVYRNHVYVLGGGCSMDPPSPHSMGVSSFSDHSCPLEAYDVVENKWLPVNCSSGFPLLEVPSSSDIYHLGNAHFCLAFNYTKISISISVHNNSREIHATRLSGSIISVQFQKEANCLFTCLK
ncbi:hypothetical protein V6N13_051930 [Hibiscus sabdariffa]